MLTEIIKSDTSGALDPTVRLTEATEVSPLESLTIKSTLTGPGWKEMFRVVLSLTNWPSILHS